MGEGFPGSIEFGAGRSVPLLVKKTTTKNGRVSLRMLPEGVLLTVPSRVSVKTARAFLESPASQKWLHDKIAGNPYLGLAPYTAQDKWEVPLAGRIIPVVWHEASMGRAEIVGNDDAIHAFASPTAPDALMRSVVQEALLARMRQDVAKMLSRWLPTIPGGFVSRLTIAPTRSQWGSMNRSRRLALASYLVGVRPSAMEYVVIHELCHQLHMDHSPAFWKQVRSRCPHYKSEEEHLRRVGLKVRALMRRIQP